MGSCRPISTRCARSVARRLVSQRWVHLRRVSPEPDFKQLHVISIFDGVFHDKVRVGRGARVVVAKRVLDSPSFGYGYLALADGSSAALTGTC